MRGAWYEADDAPSVGSATRRLLFVHAHPDDESSKGAATAARYADLGARVGLVTCTDGSAGEVLNPNAETVDPTRMAIVRRLELEAAVRTIGFAVGYELGYVDSGWHEDLEQVPEGTFWHVPLDEAGRNLAAILRAERPHVVVTYPEDGGYPHPDHIRTYHVTMRAVELAADPDALPGGGEPWQVAKVYAVNVMTREKVEELHGAYVERGLESPYERWMERLDEDRRTVSARIDVGDWLEIRDEALRAHVTQVDPDGPWFAADRAIEREVHPYDGFWLLRSEVETDPPEDDLFAGLGI